MNSLPPSRGGETSESSFSPRDFTRGLFFADTIVCSQDVGRLIKMRAGGERWRIRDERNALGGREHTKYI